MVSVLGKLTFTLMLALAWRAGAVSEDSRDLRGRLGWAFGLALMLRVAFEALKRAPVGPAQTAAGLAAALFALALFWPLARLALAGPYKKGGRVARGVFLALALLMVWLEQSGPAIMFFWFGLTRHPWLEALDTGKRFIASLASLVVALALLLGVDHIDSLAGNAADAQRIARIVRGAVIVYAAYGTLRAFKAFTTDPTLGIRRVSLRLTLSHVLVVTVPLLIVVALWLSSTYLGVNADRALVTARVLDHEADQLHAALVTALGAGGEVESAARVMGAAQRAKWPGTRVFVVRDSLVERLTGAAVDGEALLHRWVARLDSLPSRGVVQLARRRWFGAAAQREGTGLVLLAPISELLDSTLSPMVGATVTMRALGRDDAGLDSIRIQAGALRDSLRRVSRGGVDADNDSLALSRARNIRRAFGIPDSVVRAGRRGGPVMISTGSDTLDASRGEIGFTGQMNVRGVSISDRGSRAADFTLTARASFRATLVGLFAKARENPLQAIPIATLVGLGLLLLPLAQTNFKMVRGMGGSIAHGIGALRDGAAAFGAGKLDYRIPVAGDDDLWETATRFNQMAAGLEQARELEKQRDRLENELELARRIQARLLPSAAPRVPGLDVAGLSESAREVGGDYYDHLDLGGGRMLLVIADVSGKGVPAALLMSGFRASLMSQDTTSGAPDVVAGRVNDFLHKSVEPGRFVTAFFGFLDASSGRFVYVNAGHNPPLLLRADGSVEMLQEGGLILGILPDSSFKSGETKLAAGDVVLLYTDGVTEGANATNEQFGEERLIASLRASRTLPASELAHSIVREVRAFEGESGPADDITVLVARRTG